MGTWESAEGRLATGAQWYAAQGWKVLPVHGIVNDKCSCGRPHAETKDIGKHPAINSWHTEATDNSAQIQSWWESNPNYNIGVFARESGFLVIDIDPRNGGEDAYLKLEEKAQGALPPTVEAITGVHSDKGTEVRGRHLIYRCDINEKFIGNFKRLGLDGIDVKHNGYILVAPSRHFSGVTYDWKPGHAPWEMEVAEAPDELLAVIRAGGANRGGVVSSQYKQGDWDILRDLEVDGNKLDIDRMLKEGITEGSRAVDIYAIACGLANRMGTDPIASQAIEAMMLQFNYERVTPPLEVEGPNSLLMHVRRAIKFVAENPKVNLKWQGLSEWVEEKGMDVAQRIQNEGVVSITTVPSISENNATATSNFDTENLENETRSFVGDQISDLVRRGMSIGDSVSGGNLNVPKDQDAIDAEDGGTPGSRTFTDVGNSRRLIDSFGSAIRYTPGLGWFFWDGNYWKPDIENLELQEMAKRVAPVIASEAVNYSPDDARVGELINWAKQAKSNTRISNMIKSAVSDKRIQVPLEKWDGDTHLLGVSNGVIDLRTGDLLKGRPDLHITRKAPVSYTPGLKNIRWEQYLDFVTGGDKEFQEWLQKAVGYSYTGLNHQDVLFLVYGPPGSGKTTFVETIVNALGTQEYSWTLDSSVLAAGDGQANRTDEYHMAELRGRRFIWVDELPESERLKENQVKKMTGSGTLQGRSPGERPFQFRSQGKLWITTNHRPIINDDAMWRRLRPIPLTSVPESPDPELRPYLSDPDGGLPAVLAWAVEGAVKYLNSSAKDPLGWCSVVRDAADIYRKDEDRLGIFIEEETKKIDGTSINVSDLYIQYRKWSDSRGERAMTQIAFQRKFKDRGFVIEGSGSRAVLMGYSLPPRAVADSGVDWANEARFSTAF